MSRLVESPPYSPIEGVSEVLHDVSITDPYRWLEDQESSQTRAWIVAQTQFARLHLSAIPGRDRIRARIRELLDVETYDSIQKVGERYFFRKRQVGQEQPCICFRDGAEGMDQLLIDPADRGTGKYTAVKPLRVSPDGKLLLYEVKEGGERSGVCELMDVQTRNVLPESFSRGHLRGFVFAPDGRSFYYVHESLNATRPFYRAAYHHTLGTPATEDSEIFFAGDDCNTRLVLISDTKRLILLVYRFLESRLTDIYLKPFGTTDCPKPLLKGVDYNCTLLLTGDTTFVLTDKEAPNGRIAAVTQDETGELNWTDIVPECQCRIETVVVISDKLLVSYMQEKTTRLVVFDLGGRQVAEIPLSTDETTRVIWTSPESDEVLLETESFTKPATVYRYSARTNESVPWLEKRSPFHAENYSSLQASYRASDGTEIPIHLVGRSDVLGRAGNPTVMTSYGGFGISMTPQFSNFVAFLMERGCLFALPNIRGGSEFGAAWHHAARRRNRQTAYNDFLSAAEWLIKTGRTARGRLAIFGGSNSGLLVAVALTQRPDLFDAVVCMMPMLDMLRYHLFNDAHVWKEEFGTADDPEDFVALARYSPYHRVRDGVAYPATLIISGDVDQNCNPLHARKMTARLQAANGSATPIVLDYSTVRGHSPVLPLGERIDGLTDRLAFICQQLQLPV